MRVMQVNLPRDSGQKRAIRFRFPTNQEQQLKRLMIGLATSVVIAHAAAEQKHGVEVYPGAKAHPATTEFLQKSLKMQGDAYVTGDSVGKVTDFYKKQAGLKQNPGADATQSGFMGKGVMVTIQNPWMDMKSGKKETSTLVSIVKQ